MTTIQDVQADLLDRVELLKADGQNEAPNLPFAPPPKILPIKRYAVTILVDNSR